MFLDPTNVDDSVRTWFMINVHNNTHLSCWIL